MDKTQILQQAIEKAKKNGWKPIDENGREYSWCSKCNVFDCEVDDYMSHPYYSVMKTAEIIFSHDFAKAFWHMENDACIRHGDKLEVDDNGVAYCTLCYDPAEKPFSISGWQYHLQQMVLEPDPISYLEKFL